MASNRLDEGSGLLAGAVEFLELHLDVIAEWRLVIGYRDGSQIERLFSGGVDPREWLALFLASELGFGLSDSARAASILFDGFLPSPIGPGSPEPYGMAR